MVALDNADAQSMPRFSRAQIKEAMKRGELVRLLAAVQAGQISLDELEAALEERNRKAWIRRLFAILID